MVSVVASDPAAGENGDAGQFVVSRDVAAATPLKVKLTLSGTAKNGTDYTKIPTTVTIPANADSVTVTISPIDDGKIEPAETVIVTAAANSAYAISPGLASDTVTIADATYLAADFFPLIDGSRWDYSAIADGQLGSWVFEMEDQGTDMQMWIRQYYSEGSSEGYSVLNDDSGDVRVVAEIDDLAEDELTTFAPGELWFPVSMTIGQEYSFSSDRVEGAEVGTITGTIKVVKLETIKTPAGTFRALKVVSTNSEAMPDWHDQETITFWLVRGVGIVKLTSKGTDDSGDRWNLAVQLTSYSLSSQWLPQAAMTTARDQFAGGVINGKIYVFGGNGNPDGLNLKSTEVFNPAQNQWTPRADNKNNNGDGIEELTGVGLNGKLYVFGAWGGTGSNGFYGNFNFAQVYDPDTDTWTSIAPKPTPVSSAPCAVYNGEIYVFGGEFTYEDARGKERQTRYNVVEAYNPANDTWRLVTKMPKTVINPALAVVGDRAYVLGGVSSTIKPLMTPMAFDFATGTWIKKGLARMPRGRTAPYSSAAPVADGKIYLIGGYGGGSMGFFWATNLVDIYDTATNTWSTGPSLPVPVDNHLSVVAGDSLYVVGGYTFENLSDCSLDNVWRLPLT